MKIPVFGYEKDRMQQDTNFEPTHGFFAYMSLFWFRDFPAKFGF